MSRPNPQSHDPKSHDPKSTNLTTPTKAPFDRDAQYQAKRRAVIKQAAGRFGKNGYHHTPMVEIAKDLGLTKAALYYYVKNKEEILFECHIMVYDEMDVLLKGHKDAATGLERLRAIYYDFVMMLTREGMALLTDVDSLSSNNRSQVLARREKIERAVTRLVKTGIADGSIKATDPKVCVFFIMGTLNWLNVWYRSNGRMDNSEIAALFSLQMVAGIAA